MSYNYATQRPYVFTETGQVMLLKIRDQARVLMSKAGAATCEKLTAGCCTGDTWNMLACIDRLVEIGDLHEIENAISRAGQHRIFINLDWS